jgi:acyl carrier protein
MSIPPAEHEIGEWLASYIGELIAKPAAEIDHNATFGSFGIDSANVIGITGELQEELGISIDPEAAYDYPTIRSLASYLASQKDAPADGKSDSGSVRDG